MADAAQDRSYGGFWVRFLAYLVDSVVACTLLFLLIPVAALLGESGGKLFTVACLLVPVLYWALMHASARQATLGKALLGMKVASAQGERISVPRSLGRELAKYISAFPLMVGFLLAAFTGRKQALHDIVASTVVLREGSSHTLVALLLGVFGWLAPVAVLMFVGLGALLAMMGGMGADMMMQQAMQQQAMHQQAVRQPPMKASPRPVPAPADAAPKAAPSVAVAPKVEAPKPASPRTDPPQADPAPAAVVQPVAMAPDAPRPPAPRAAPRPRQPRAEAGPSPAPAAPAGEPKSAVTLKYNDLMTAVMMRDGAAVDELLRLGKWVDKPDRYGTTPLAVAVRLKDAATAEALLRAGADPGRALPTAREQGDAAMLALLERYRK